ncbi:unnamed protein product [Leuciscus chuanchicus]
MNLIQRGCSQHKHTRREEQRDAERKESGIQRQIEGARQGKRPEAQREREDEKRRERTEEEEEEAGVNRSRNGIFSIPALLRERSDPNPDITDHPSSSRKPATELSRHAQSFGNTHTQQKPFPTNSKCQKLRIPLQKHPRDQRLYHTSGGIQTGTNQIQTGTNQIQTGTNQIQIGTNQIQAGTNQIQAGTNQIQTGTNQMQTGTNQIQTGKKQIQIGTNQIQAGTNQI